jgi:hypothetical protein
LVFPGGLATVTVAEPDCALFVWNPLPTLVPAEQEYEIESDIPTSAICGWHEICAASRSGVVPFGTHCQLLTQAPLYVGFHVPALQSAGLGCTGAAGQFCPCCTQALPEHPFGQVRTTVSTH